MTLSQSAVGTFLVSFWLVGVSICAQDRVTRAAEPTAKEVQAAFAKAAEDYEILKADSATRLALRESPLLKWSNPARAEQQGIVFVWLDDGNPLVIGSMFTFHYRGLRAKYEFHSLTSSPLSATHRGKKAWSPNSPGVQWRPVTDVGAPGRTKGLRLTQMKQIAQSFEVTLVAPDGDRTTLRLLSTPLLRFASPSNAVTDGTIFSYAIATDPEALLIVRDTGGRWEYAFARFHYWQLEAKRKGSPVWSVQLDQGMEGNRLGDRAHMSKVYSSFYPEPDYLFKP